MSRHAQRHWLGIQAARAVESAHSWESEPSEEFKNMVRDYGLPFTYDYYDELIRTRNRYLLKAAQSLVKAELLHREIVSRGGKP